MVHENEFIPVAGIGAVGVDAEEQLGVGVVDGEAVIGEEKRGFQDGEMGFFFEYVGLVDLVVHIWTGIDLVFEFHGLILRQWRLSVD